MGMEKWGLTAGYTLSSRSDAWTWETIHQDQIRQIWQQPEVRTLPLIAMQPVTFDP